MRPVLTGGQGALLRSLSRWLEAERVGRDLPLLVVESLESEAWASATFAGARHQLDVRIEGDRAIMAAAGIAGRLGEAELLVPGAIVADVALVHQETSMGADGTTCRLRFELVTVDE
jgi:hypothetical protein